MASRGLCLSRQKYRAAGQSDAPRYAPIEVYLPPSHQQLLDLVRDFIRAQGDGCSSRRFLSELVQNELERWLEDATDMRLGEYLAKRAAGRQFKFVNHDGAVELEEEVIQ